MQADRALKPVAHPEHVASTSKVLELPTKFVRQDPGTHFEWLFSE